MQKPKQCRECPHFRDGYCSVYAKFVSGMQRACEYGRRRMRNAYSAKWMANKRRGS